MNPGTFLLRWYWYILLCFYYVATGTCSSGSEFKYPGPFPTNECSIVLEICPSTNPTLNLPNSVNKCKTDMKNLFVNATVQFQLTYMQIWTALSNRDDTGFEPELLVSWVRPWATEQTYYLWKPIDTSPDRICVLLTFKSISFQIPQHINIVLKS